MANISKLTVADLLNNSSDAWTTQLVIDWAKSINADLPGDEMSIIKIIATKLNECIDQINTPLSWISWS